MAWFFRLVLNIPVLNLEFVSCFVLRIFLPFLYSFNYQLRTQNSKLKTQNPELSTSSVDNLTFEVCQIAALLSPVIFTQFCPLFLQKYPLLPQNTPKSVKNAHFSKTTNFDINPTEKETYINFRETSQCTIVQAELIVLGNFFAQKPTEKFTPKSKVSCNLRAVADDLY